MPLQSLLYRIFNHARPQKFFQREKRRHFTYHFNIADVAKEMDVHKTPYHFTQQRIFSVTRQQPQKMHFVGRNSQVYYDNLRNRLSADF